ncbi:protein of unknown function [Methylococcus capsulatus]|uniref:Uncharacterized protein n=1 Tax=Methylococcus capsulatus TaxID=414 RepID=A0AA35XYU2_METCP|nr:protein of unknown function [Methylococcus capsulatus]
MPRAGPEFLARGVGEAGRPFTLPLPSSVPPVHRPALPSIPSVEADGVGLGTAACQRHSDPRRAGRGFRRRDPFQPQLPRHLRRQSGAGVPKSGPVRARALIFARLAYGVHVLWYIQKAGKNLGVLTRGARQFSVSQCFRGL